MHGGEVLKANAALRGLGQSSFQPLNLRGFSDGRPRELMQVTDKRSSHLQINVLNQGYEEQ
jgi:hypothetical protein